MSTTPTWTEYLAAADAHLAATRTALETGAATPPELVRPSGPMPAAFAQRATSLSVGYAQLAVELSVAKDVVERRLGAFRRTVAAGPPTPRYVDAPL